MYTPTIDLLIPTCLFTYAIVSLSAKKIYKKTVLIKWKKPVTIHQLHYSSQHIIIKKKNKNLPKKSSQVSSLYSESIIFKAQQSPWITRNIHISPKYHNPWRETQKGRTYFREITTEKLNRRDLLCGTYNTQPSWQPKPECSMKQTPRAPCPIVNAYY